MKTPLDASAEIDVPDVLPVLALSETVVFPYVIVPLSVEPDRGVQAVDAALSHERLVMLVAQTDPTVERPGLEHLHRIGTVGQILRMLKLPDGRIRILVQGLVRARLEALGQEEPFLRGRVSRLDATVAGEAGAGEPGPKSSEAADVDSANARVDQGEPESADPPLEREALLRSVRDHLEKTLHLGRGGSAELMLVAANLDDPGRLADLAASNLELELRESQALLEQTDGTARLARISELLAREIEVLTMQHHITNQAQDEIDRSQREYYLRQQIKAIQRELGEADETAEEIAGFRSTAERKAMPLEARQEMEKQIRRLENSHPESGETTVIRTYLDWLVSLPWGEQSADRLDLEHAREVLDADHYGLEKIKERIVEFLAVRKLKSDSKGPILCFVGPPGVGKTSLGRSIARALEREFVRLSLGGVRDEAEIRGHRRTYVGALPGRIIQSLAQAGTSNPVFMLDEIDKLGSYGRSDPSSALLEVLDPEQNASFRDHYLGVPYDLSKVLFIATANLLDPIQPAFLDRMEVIRLTGYTAEEKALIARRHLLPKQMRENGLEPEHLHLTEPGLRKVIRSYTREAGLRNLERELGALCRKAAVRVADGKTEPLRIDPKRVSRLLGPERHFGESLLDRHRVGVATGLAWTAAGGDLLLIEAIAVPGRGRLQLTGRLGEVMRESAQAALSYARKCVADGTVEATLSVPTTPTTGPTAGALSTAASGIAPGTGADSSDRAVPAGTASTAADLFSRVDFHVHAPAGSIPKDGPSAGITIAAALLSVISGRPVDREVAMTGEITLRGDVLPIGGLKEKALAARAAGIQRVIIPKLNERDLHELPRAVRRDVAFYCFGHMDDVLDLALLALEPESKASASRPESG